MFIIRFSSSQGICFSYVQCTILPPFFQGGVNRKTPLTKAGPPSYNACNRQRRELSSPAGPAQRELPHGARKRRRQTANYLPEPDPEGAYALRRGRRRAGYSAREGSDPVIPAERKWYSDHPPSPLLGVGGGFSLEMLRVRSGETSVESGELRVEIT